MPVLNERLEPNECFNPELRLFTTNETDLTFANRDVFGALSGDGGDHSVVATVGLQDANAGSVLSITFERLAPLHAAINGDNPTIGLSIREYIGNDESPDNDIVGFGFPTTAILEVVASVPDCSMADADGDMDLDLADHAAMLNCFSGPNETNLRLDQSFVAPQLGTPTSYILAEGFAYSAQTVTAEMTGALVSVDLAFQRSSQNTRPWIVSIREVIGGLPNDNVLASEMLQASEVPVLTRGDEVVHVRFSNPASFDSSDQFAIVVYPEGVVAQPGEFAGSWSGVSGGAGAYEGGQSIASNTSDFATSNVDPGDKFFQTYMVTGAD